MGGIGGMELLVIGLVALIVVGPKDLPGMFRTLGQFTAKAKGMAREFSQAMEAAADEAGVKDVQKTIRDATNPKKMGLDAVKKAASFEDRKPLSPERAEAAEKIRSHSAKTAEDRIAKETAAKAEALQPAAPETTPEPATGTDKS